MSNGLLPVKPECHNVIDDISGRKIRSDKAVKNWEGLITSEEDFDPKHPQLNVRARPDKMSVTPTRVRPDDKFVTSVNPNSLNQRQ